LERELFIDNLLVRIHFIIVMIRWAGLTPWEFEFAFPGSLTSTFLGIDCAGSTGGPAIDLADDRSGVGDNLMTTYWSESTLSS